MSVLKSLIYVQTFRCIQMNEVVVSKSKSEESNQEAQESGRDWVQDTRDEIAGMVKDGFDHDSTKPVLKAAAVGAVAGVVLPGVGLAAGLVAGAGLALHHAIRK